MLARFRLASALWLLPIVGCDVHADDSTVQSKPLPIDQGTGSSVGGAGHGGSGGSGGTGGTGGGGGGSGGAGQCMGGGPGIETAGDLTKILLKGTVLTPAGPLAGQVYIDGNTIACVDVSCEAQASGATVIDTHGIISPGFIDTHNHILFDIFDETDWAPDHAYDDHDQWPDDPKYKAMVDTKQYLDGETSASELGCEMNKYGEMKGLVAGTTSIQGSPGGGAGACYGSLARSLDISANDLPQDKMQTATIFPSTTAADGVCANFNDGDTTAYVVHVGEGVNPKAEMEFGKLGTISTVDQCLYDSRTTIVHGTALTDADFATMGAHGMNLVWSPQSNVFLYGTNTDLSKTTNIPQALSHGINVSIGPDWSIGGSQNILDELRFADKVDNAQFGNIFDAKALWEMVTSHPAQAMGLSAFIGSIEVGKRADLAVFLGDTSAPYDAILAATPREVTAVFVDGRLLYGDAALQPAGPANATCEALDVCCRSKVACVAETGGASKLDQTFAQFSMAISDGLSAYDALAITQWDFAPIAPLVKCN